MVDRLRFLDNGLIGQVKLDIGFWELFSFLFRCIPAINPHHCCSHAYQFLKSCYFTGSPHDGDPVPQKQSPAAGGGQATRVNAAHFSFAIQWDIIHVPGSASVAGLFFSIVEQHIKTNLIHRVTQISLNTTR